MRRIDLKKAQVARSSTIRGINRQIVLNYVRDREPISRAEIARETALQRYLSNCESVAAVKPKARATGDAVGQGHESPVVQPPHRTGFLRRP
jgi:hypothetical protein